MPGLCSDLVYVNLLIVWFNVAVKKVLSLCDSLSAIDDIKNGVLCSLVSDFVSMLRAVTGPFAQQEATSHVTVCTLLYYYGFVC